jgi:hypothetical protein
MNSRTSKAKSANSRTDTGRKCESSLDSRAYELRNTNPKEPLSSCPTPKTPAAPPTDDGSTMLSSCGCLRHFAGDA